MSERTSDATRSRPERKRNRVLIIVQNLPVPFDRRVWLEATALEQAGYVVSVVSPKGKGFDASHEIRDGVHVHRYPVPGEARGFLGFLFEFTWCFLWTAWLTARIALTGPGFDVIHACNPPDTYWALARLWQLRGKRFVFDHHDLSPEMYAVKFDGGRKGTRRVLEWLERASFKTASTVITTNQSHKRVAVERGSKAPGDVFVVRSGPDLERFRRFPPDGTWKRGKRFLLVYLGEMCSQDGVDYLVRALEHLGERRQCVDFHCVFVGGGPHQASIRAYATERNVHEQCTFTGRVSDEELCRILSSADVAVDPDPKNEWSDKSTMNKIVEYMYFGLPIVCFDLEEHRVSAGDSALYAVPNREEDLAARIDDLLENEDQRERMGSIGKRRVMDELAWQYSVPTLLAAYEHARLGHAERAEAHRRSLSRPFDHRHVLPTHPDGETSEKPASPSARRTSS